MTKTFSSEPRVDQALGAEGSETSVYTGGWRPWSWIEVLFERPLSSLALSAEEETPVGTGLRNRYTTSVVVVDVVVRGAEAGQR